MEKERIQFPKGKQKEFIAEDIFELMQMLGFNPRFYTSNKCRRGKLTTDFSVRLNGYKNFQLYKTLIGSKQPKNLQKIKEWEKRILQ